MSWSSTLTGVTPADVVYAVAEYSGLPVEDILGRSRSTPVVQYRHLAMAVARRETGWSYPALGRYFDRHHWTIVHAYQRVTSDPGALGLVDRLALRARALAVTKQGEE